VNVSLGDIRLQRDGYRSNEHDETSRWA
jgi:hypothetical protein